MIQLSSVAHVSASTDTRGVDAAVRARPVGLDGGIPSTLFEAAEAVLRASGATLLSKVPVGQGHFA